MNAPARITSYKSFVLAIRALKAERRLTDALVDELGGLTPGHTSKVLCDPAERGIGPSTLEGLMTALAFDLQIIDSPEKRAQMEPYWDGSRRKDQHVRERHPPRDRTLIRVMRELGHKHYAKMLASGKQASIVSKGGIARRDKLTRERRKEIAKLAARARWGSSAVASPDDFRDDSAGDSEHEQ